MFIPIDKNEMMKHYIYDAIGRLKRANHITHKISPRKPTNNPAPRKPTNNPVPKKQTNNPAPRKPTNNPAPKKQTNNPVQKQNPTPPAQKRNNNAPVAPNNQGQQQLLHLASDYFASTQLHAVTQIQISLMMDETNATYLVNKNQNLTIFPLIAFYLSKYFQTDDEAMKDMIRNLQTQDCVNLVHNKIGHYCDNLRDLDPGDKTDQAMIQHICSILPIKQKVIKKMKRGEWDKVIRGIENEAKSSIITKTFLENIVDEPILWAQIQRSGKAHIINANRVTSYTRNDCVVLIADGANQIYITYYKKWNDAKNMYLNYTIQKERTSFKTGTSYNLHFGPTMCRDIHILPTSGRGNNCGIYAVLEFMNIAYGIEYNNNIVPYYRKKVKDYAIGKLQNLINNDHYDEADAWLLSIHGQGFPYNRNDYNSKRNAIQNTERDLEHMYLSYEVLKEYFIHGHSIYVECGAINEAIKGIDFHFANPATININGPRVSAKRMAFISNVNLVHFEAVAVFDRDLMRNVAINKQVDLSIPTFN
jgi:hypothetical protein